MFIQIFHIFIFSLLVHITKARVCPPDMYLSNDKCEDCSLGCNLCDEMTSECLLCEDHFYEKNGSCYHECNKPFFPFWTESGEISCNPIPYYSATSSNNLIDDYESQNGINSSYLILDPDFKSYIEVSFWIKIESMENKERTNYFFILTNTKSPYPDFVQKPTIIKFGIQNGMLIGPNQISDFNITLKTKSWIYLSLYMNLPYLDHPFVNMGLYLLSIDAESSLDSFNYMAYPSTEALDDYMLLHLGRFSNDAEFSFNLKNIQIRSVKAQLFVGLVDSFIKNSLFYMKNDQIITCKFPEQRVCGFNAEIINDFQEIIPYKFYFIRAKFQLLDAFTPFTFFQIDSGDQNIITLEVIRIEDNLFIYARNKTMVLLTSQYFDINLYFFTLSKEIKMFYEDLTLSFQFKNELQIKINNSQLYFVLDYMSISENPSIFSPDFEIYSTKQNLSILQNENFLNSVLGRFKFCPHRSFKKYFFSLDECNDQFDTHCYENIQNCLICLGANFCGICKIGYSRYKGHCFKDCPISYYKKDYDEFVSVCILCEEHYKYFNSEKTCVSCPLDDIENCEVVVHVAVVHNCIIDSSFFSCFSCPTGCNSCWKNKESLICIQCHPDYFFYEESCYKFCPKDLFPDTQTMKCLKICDEKNSNTMNCMPCQILKGNKIRRICPENCRKSFINNNGVCINLNKVDNCLLQGREYCEFESENNGSERQKIAKTLSVPDYRNTTNYGQKFYLNFEDFEFDCNKKLCKNARFTNLGCCHHLVRTELSIIDSENEITTRDDIDCNLVYDEYYTIKFNESCIFIPNSHFNILRHNINIEIHENIKRVNFSNYSGNLIDLGNISLCSQVPSDKLYLPCFKNCPLSFYQDKTFSCKKCPHDCLRCELVENDLTCLNKTKFSSKSGITDEGIFDIYFDIPINHPSETLKFLYYSEFYCPKGCKTCYNIGYKFICLTCVDSRMKISKKDFLCSCTANLFYDEKSKMCISSCPSGSLVQGSHCQKKCNPNSININQFPNFQKQEIMYTYNNTCIAKCPDSLQSVRNSEFEDFLTCRKIDLKNADWELKSFDFDNFFQEIQRKGFAYLSSTGLIKSKKLEFINYLKKISPRTEEEQIKVLSAFAMTFSKGVSTEYYCDEISQFINYYYNNSKSMTVLLKAVYIYQILSLNCGKRYFPAKIHFPLPEENLWNIILSENFEIQIELENYYQNRVAGYYDIIKTNFICFIISIKVSALSPRKSFKSGEFRVFRTNTSTTQVYFLSIVNLTHKKPFNLEFGEPYPIKMNSMYIGVITSYKLMEEIDIIINDELLFGIDEPAYENDIISPEKTNEHSLMKNVEILVYITVIVLVIAAFIWFLRTKIFEESKIKFVQMAETEELDDENVQEDTTNHFE